MKHKRKKTLSRDISLLNFFAEAGQLKRVQRSGWWTVGIKMGESVADHSFRCALIGYCIALCEGYDAQRTALLCLFNDIHEARITDVHKLAQQYFDLKRAEKRALRAQIAKLPRSLACTIGTLMSELSADTTPESVAARDADLLECMLQGKEYFDQGFVQARRFFTKAQPLLKTRTAQRLGKKLASWNSRTWLDSIVTVKR